MKVMTSRYLRNLRKLDDDFDRPCTRFAPDMHINDGTIVYHALFGNARKMPGQVRSLLNRCMVPTDITDLCDASTPKMIEELLRLSFLVPEAGADERMRIDVLMEERPDRLRRGELFSALQLVLTNSCNFSCDYCFAYTFENNVAERLGAGERVPVMGSLREGLAEDAGKERKKIIPIKQSQASVHMSHEVAEAAVENAVRTRLATGGDTLSVSLFGGEPTLNRGLILHLLRKYGRGEQFGLRIDWDITTNGSRMDPELRKALKDYCVDTAVSIDYIDGVTGEYRGGARQSVAWDVINTNIQEMLLDGIPVHITSVLSVQTWDKWGDALIDWAADSGIDEINVIVSFDNKFFDRHSPESVADRLFQAFVHGQKRGVLLSGYWYQTYSLIVNQDKFARQADYKTCPAIGRMLSVEPNGSIFTCKATSARVGDVAAWQKTFSSAEYRNYGMRAYRNSPECSGCELEGTCSGGSAGALESTYGAIEKMHSGYCTYMRRIVNRLLDYHLAADRAPTGNGGKPVQKKNEPLAVGI